MPIFSRLAWKLFSQLSRLSWHSVLVALVSYILISFLGLYWAEEPVAQGSPVLFWYFLIVTSSTVGYGDYSASTPAGMLIISSWVIPFGLMIWGMVVGRMAAAIIQYFQRSLKGMSQLQQTNHTLVIGYNGPRTAQLIQLLLREAASPESANVALCAHQDKLDSNPLPDQIGFVRVSSFNNEAEMHRANIGQAATILIDTPLDDITLTTAMFCYQQNPAARILAYFNDDAIARLLKAHCPSVECIPSVSVEMLAKTAADPGSSALHHELLAVDKGMTQYSVEVPAGVTPVFVRDLFLRFKERHQATVIALQSDGPDSLVVNPAMDLPVAAGCRVHYIADERIKCFDWSAS
ncbi:MAG: ion channel [Halopseudomonas sp.]